MLPGEGVAASRYTLAALVENHFGVLARVAGLISRRGFNIESLAVGPAEGAGLARMTIVLAGEPAQREQIVRQLDKLVDVLSVQVVDEEGAGAAEGVPRPATSAEVD